MAPNWGDNPDLPGTPVWTSRAAMGEQTSLAERKRRAGQRLVVGLPGLQPGADFKAFCAEVQPAGFILFGRNVAEPAQVRELNRELVSLLSDRLPPFLSVDQEGGRVQRIRETTWPSMRTVGNFDDEALTRQLARALADELRALGFNLDFAPVADVDSNPANPVIGDRSFGRQPDRVARQVTAFVQEAQAAGLICCAKHFPGHGDTSVDSHKDLPVVDKDRRDVEQVELPPFQAAIAAGVGCIMTAHVMFPAWDEDYPATLSRELVDGLLRRKLGYGGVVISDDMEMKAVRGRYALDEQLLAAVGAGVDLFCISRMFETELTLAHQAFEELVRQQESDRRFDQLAEDSELRLKALRERFFKEPPAAPPLSVVGSRAHRDLALWLEARGGGIA